MNAEDFLKEKGLIQEGFTEFTIVMKSQSINLTELLDEYIMAKRKDSYTQIDRNVVNSLAASQTKELQKKVDGAIETLENIACRSISQDIVSVIKDRLKALKK